MHDMLDRTTSLAGHRRALLSATILLVGSGFARSEDSPPAAKKPATATDGLSIGETLADFELRDTAGKIHRLADYESRKVLVIALNGVGCPISKLTAKTLLRIERSVRDQGVQFLGLNANRHDTVPELRAFRSEFELPFPLLKDHGNVVADRLGAKRTTEVYVFDAERKLRYRGAIDDQYVISERSVGIRKTKAEQTYLADAVESLLAGENVEVASTEASGCIIGRQRTAKKDTELTYHRDVEPIVQSRCQSCHRDGQIAPFNLLTYDDVAGWAGMIEEVVETRRMPPWHADPKHGLFENDRSLSEAERETIVAWVQGGTPKGDPKDAPKPIEYTSSWQLGDPDAVVEMPREYRVPASGTVPYKYFTVPTKFANDRWVRAMEITPGAREVVHHILVFAIDPENPRESIERAQGGARSYFGAMVPGERPIVFPDGMAKPLPAGSTLVFQMHYTPSGTPRTDRSKIGLWFGEKPTRGEVRTRSAVARRLNIPPRAEAHEVRALTRFSKNSRLLSLLPHMHLRGSSFRYVMHYPNRIPVSRPPSDEAFEDIPSRRIRYDEETGELFWAGAISDAMYERFLEAFPEDSDRKAFAEARKNAKSEILLHVPVYDFGWQSTYRLAEPKDIPAGSVLEAIATFDNSPSNPALTKSMWSRKVRWGEQTWDEMMIGYFDYVYAVD